ncbi:MAG TPA: RNA polymerase Rbp10, partial [Candidatus Nitrosopelagicus sp.]|nr:RNA polymerase Rbp10 [Candidatus Nitrosopelagicus sp.]
MIDETDSTDVEQAEKFDVIYSCLRCAIKVS